MLTSGRVRRLCAMGTRPAHRSRGGPQPALRAATGRSETGKLGAVDSAGEMTETCPHRFRTTLPRLEEQATCSRDMHDLSQSRALPAPWPQWPRSTRARRSAFAGRCRAPSGPPSPSSEAPASRSPSASTRFPAATCRSSSTSRARWCRARRSSSRPPRARSTRGGPPPAITPMCLRRGGRVLHRSPVRPADRRIPGLEAVRRRQRAARRALQPARCDRYRQLLHRPGDLRLVP